MTTNKPNAQTEQISEKYLSDNELAVMLGLSPSWCRRQRYLRQRELHHDLIIDPVYIGSSPRYPLSEVRSWLEALK